MALVVEDGTKKADAESYASVATAAAYAVKHGLVFSSTESDATEGALRRATTWIDGRYRGRFLGYRAKGREQALEWPRYDAVNKRPPYDSISSDSVPIEVVNATIEVAVRELATPNIMSPTVTPSQVVKSASVSGAVSVEYFAPGGVNQQRPVITAVEDIIEPVVSTSNILTGSSGRG